jgi:hypothetical protein
MTLHLKFVRDKVTANTVRFKEVADKAEAVVGQMYVRKSVAGSIDELSVTLTSEE